MAQATETHIVTVRTHLNVFRRNVQPRQNLPDNVLSAEDATVCEKREFTALRVVGNASSGELLVFGIGNLFVLHEFGPIINVAALVNLEFAVMTGLGERCGVNQEFSSDEVNDSDFG